MNGNSNSRRGFLKGFGLLSAVLAGGTAYRVSPTSTGGAVRDSSTAIRSSAVDENLAPTSTTHLSLVADNAEPQTNKVTLSVGKDNRLWANVDGQWRRIALEG